MARFIPDPTIGLYCLGFGIAAGLAAALGAGLRWNRALMRCGRARAPVVRYLDRAWDPGELYLHLASGAVRAFDRFFEAANPAPGGRVPVWSAAAMDASMRLALAAPVAGWFLSWLIDGHAGPTATALGLLRGAGPGFRAVAAGVAAWTLLTVYRAARADGWRLAAWLAGALAGLAAGAHMVGTTDPSALPGLDSGNGSFAGSVALPVAAAVAVATRGPVAAAFACTGLVAVGVNGDGSLADAVLLIIAVALLPVADAARARGGFVRFTALYWPGALLAACGLLALDAWLRSPAIGRIVLLAIGIAPLLQGPFIWLSVTLARATLGQLADRKHPPPLALAIANLCGAGALALLLPNAAAAGLAALNGGVAGNSLSFGAASAAILIPSACNGAIWIASLVAWAFPARYRARLISEIERPRPLRRSERLRILAGVTWMVFAGAAAGAASVSVLGFGLWYVASR